MNPASSEVRLREEAPGGKGNSAAVATNSPCQGACSIEKPYDGAGVPSVTGVTGLNMLK